MTDPIAAPAGVRIADVDHAAVARDPTQTLQTFSLNDLAVYTREGSFPPDDSPDFRVFYVGRDDVHGVLKHLLSRCSRVLKMNMFGYDDDELDGIIKGLVEDQHVFVQGTLDRSQAGGVHEKKILAAWAPEMRASFAVGTSATHQISHTKGGVLDGVVAWEGSTNWSASGEGSGIDLAASEAWAQAVEAAKATGMTAEAAEAHADEVAPKQPTGFKAQNNTLTVYQQPVEIVKFATRLDEEHANAVRQAAERSAKEAPAAT